MTDATEEFSSELADPSVLWLAGADQYRDVFYAPSGRVARQTPLTGRVASELSDLRSMSLDLDRVVRLCDRFDAIDEADELLASAVREAAVIAYGRCFNTGRPSMGKGPRRRMPTKALDDLAPELRALHDEVLADRNQHVGHRVSRDAERITVVALSEPDEDDAYALCIPSLRLMRRAAHTDRLRSLADAVQRGLMSVLNAESEELLRSSWSQSPSVIPPSKPLGE